jgi:hypothetical protein|tara:strand:+ start:1920 stop:2171 length:252 start_codon:yes stop_codon:yes gene_type:complete
VVIIIKMAVQTTRSGRKIKKPETFTPTESDVVDDWGEDDHDSEFNSDIDTEEEEDYTSGDDDSDADENGNLKDFVVDSDSESE